MRMDRREDLTAEEIVNTWSEKKLGELFRDLGEERKWRHAAKAIVTSRRKERIKTTKQLSDLLCEAVGKTRKKLHPATLVFQALRMCVNKELKSVERGITRAMDALAPGGRIGAISFHSLEDRIVKNLFRDAARPLEKYADALMHLVTKKPIVPDFLEKKRNPRSRSAKLRFAEKN